MLSDSNLKDAINKLTNAQVVDSPQDTQPPKGEQVVWVNIQMLVRPDGTTKILKGFVKPVAKPKIKKKPEPVKFNIGGKEKIE